jgi:hypothetical protein
MLKSLLMVAWVLFMGLDNANAAQLVYYHTSGRLVLFDKQGKQVGAWRATNNVVKNHQPFPSGPFPLDKRRTHQDDSPASYYGSYGILLFKVPKRDNLGVHSGKKNLEYPTHGSIRTTDAAMYVILTHHARDKITELLVAKK